MGRIIYIRLLNNKLVNAIFKLRGWLDLDANGRFEFGWANIAKGDPGYA